MSRFLLALALLFAPAAWAQNATFGGCAKGTTSATCLAGNGALNNSQTVFTTQAAINAVNNGIVPNTSKGQTIVLAGNVPLTLALGDPGGYDAGFQIKVVNGDVYSGPGSGRGKLIDGHVTGSLPFTLRQLYPGQSTDISLQNGAWIASKSLERWRAPPTNTYAIPVQTISALTANIAAVTGATSLNDLNISAVSSGTVLVGCGLYNGASYLAQIVNTYGNTTTGHYLLDTNVGTIGSTSLTIGCGVATVGSTDYLQTGDTMNVSGNTPSGYNATGATPIIVNATQVVYPIPSNPGAATVLGTVTDTIQYLELYADYTNGLQWPATATGATAASWAAGTITYAVTSSSGLHTGDNGTFVGFSPAGYNGTCSITVVDGTHVSCSGSNPGTQTTLGKLIVGPNDCLARGVGNACFAMGASLIQANDNFDAYGASNPGFTFVRINAAAGNNDLSNIHFSPHYSLTDGGKGFILNGSTSNTGGTATGDPTSTQTGNTNGTLQLYFSAVVEVQNLILTVPNGVNNACMDVLQGGMAYLLGNVKFLNCGAAGLNEDTQARVYYNGQILIACPGNSPPTFFNIKAGSVMQAVPLGNGGNAAIAFEGACSFTQFVFGTQNAVVALSSTPVLTNGFTIAGSPWVLHNGATLTNVNATLPGTGTSLVDTGGSVSQTSPFVVNECDGNNSGTTTCTFSQTNNATWLQLDVTASGGAGGNGASLGAAGSGSGGAAGGAGSHTVVRTLWASMVGPPTGCTVTIPAAHVGGAIGGGNLTTVQCGSNPSFRFGAGGDGANGSSAAAAGGGGGGGATSGSTGTTAAGAAGIGGAAGNTGTGVSISGPGGAGGGGSSAVGLAAAGGGSAGAPSAGGGGQGCNGAVANTGGSSLSGVSFAGASTAAATPGANDAAGNGLGGGGGAASASNSGATGGGNGGVPGGGGGGGGSLCNAATGTAGVGGQGGAARVVATQF